MIRNFTDHAANERTFLAWVRTVIAIEGFGIAAARLAKNSPALWSELSLLGIGLLVIALAFVRLVMLKRRIDADGAEEEGGAANDALLLALTASLFALVAFFMVHLSS